MNPTDLLDPNSEVRKNPKMSDLPQSSQLEQSSLNQRQWAAIDLLLMGKSLGEVARAIEIDPRTLYTWRQDERFAWELSRLRRELWGEAAERLAAMVHPALDILQQQLQERYDRTRFRAAAAVLRLARLHKEVAEQAGN
jgi:hypothetical protein